jgi:hypothetical protein
MYFVIVWFYSQTDHATQMVLAIYVEINAAARAILWRMEKTLAMD